LLEILMHIDGLDPKKPENRVTALCAVKLAPDAIGKLVQHFPKSLICGCGELLVTT
jgi:hypothetical protein